jgi:hypothetical protein
MTGRLEARLKAAAEAAAEAALQRTREALAQRAEAHFADSDVAVAMGDDGDVRLRGRGLLVRAFGSRKRASDARFAGLMATLARGERT